MKYYLHTINGKPAGFNGKQICYANKGHTNSWKAPLVKDLKTIRTQQKKTFEYRRKLGEIYDKNQTKYDYVIVEIQM